MPAIVLIISGKQFFAGWIPLSKGLAMVQVPLMDQDKFTSAKVEVRVFLGWSLEDGMIRMELESYRTLDCITSLADFLRLPLF